MNNRMLRADAEIQKELAEIINNELNDPRLDCLITVTGVKTSSDFTSCKAGIGVYDQDIKKRKDIIKILQKSSGFIKRTLAENLKLRNIPNLVFTLDDGSFYEEKIEDILSTLKISPKEDEN